MIQYVENLNRFCRHFLNGSDVTITMSSTQN